MADTKGRAAVKIVDPTTGANEARVTAAGNVGVDIGATITIPVDTELPAAAALADAAANPTTPIVGAGALIFNGTTWDRMREVVAAQDSPGTGIQAAGILGQFDDTSTATVTENQFAPVRISTRRALLVEGVASGTNLNVNLAASGATVTVDTELTAAAALADAVANPTVVSVGAYLAGYNGTTWDRLRSTTANGLAVDVTRVTGTVTVDSELPAAAALADAVANPTVPAVGSYLVGFNGTTWDRVRTANTGRLQVDVITGGGSATPANPIIAYFTKSALAAGASTTTELQTSAADNKKLTRLDAWASVPYKAAIQTVDNGTNSANKVVGGGQAGQAWGWVSPHKNYLSVGSTAGLDAFACIITNLDQSAAADVYATFAYED